MNTTDRLFWNVRDYGAKGDQRTDDRQAIQQAIDACADAGGGAVALPAGDYVSGTLHLRDCVTLWLQAGATLWGSTERSDYDVPHLIYAKDARDISILGPGRIDGQGEAFWVRQGDRWRPAGWRPGKLLHFEGCRNVRMRDFTVQNAPAWTIHPFRCDTVTICGVTILNDRYGPNTDGIDPNCSTNVHISDCHIIAGDDCIVLKATEAHPCENVTVTNCTLETTCAALKLGTESHGDIRHCAFSNCTIRNTSAGITLYAKDGGVMEDVMFSDITIEMADSPMYQKREWAVFMDLERRGEASKVGAIRDVTLRNIVIHTGGRCVMQGMGTRPIERLTLDGVTLKVRGFDNLEGIRKPRGGRTHWEDPEAGPHVGAPAHLVFSNVTGLRLRDVAVIVETEDGLQERSAVFGDALQDVEISGFHGRQSGPDGSLPALRLRNCRGVFVRGCRAPEGTGTFLQVDGAETQQVSVMGNDLCRAARAVSAGPEVGEGAVYTEANRS